MHGIIDDDDDDDAHDSGPDNEPRAAEPKRQRRVGRTATIGDFILLVLINDLSGWWPTPVSDDTILQSSGKVAAVCLSRWVCEGTASVSDDFSALVAKERSRTRARDIFGYIPYPITEIAKLSSPADPEAVACEQMRMRCSQHASEYHWSISEFARDPQWSADLVRILESGRVFKEAPRVCSLNLHPGMIEWILSNPRMAHGMALTDRVRNKRIVARSEPELTDWKLNQLRKTVGSHAGRPDKSRPPKHRKRFQGMHDPNMVLGWLEASMEVRSTRHLNRAALTFQHFRQGQWYCISPFTVMGALKPANCQVVRSARVRLYVVACNLFRMMWDRLISDDVSVYLYLDSSPQLKGEELFAVSFEVFDPGGQLVWERRLAPLVALQKDFFDACGKALALTWIMCLLTGPAVDAMFGFCRCVKRITTDM